MATKKRKKKFKTKQESAQERRVERVAPLSEKDVEALRLQCEKLGVGALFRSTEFNVVINAWPEHKGALVQLKKLVDGYGRR